MGKRDGVIRSVHECHCFKCERAALGLGPTKFGAAQELIRDGWKKIKGRWYCFYCANELEGPEE